MRLLSFLCCVIIIFNPLTGSMDSYAQKSYEDYVQIREKKMNRDRPLSEIRTGESEDVLDEVRGAVREEIDDSISKERKASKKKIDKSKFIRDIRQIVREEIEDAIKIKGKRFLAEKTFEIGGFISYQSKGIESNESDNNSIIKIFPMMSYFLHSNVAIWVKGAAVINLTSNAKSYNAGMGPMFIFALDRSEEICFYTTVFAGASKNSTIKDSIGYRYGNELGLKFVLTSGVILNLGVMIVFDNAGDKVTGFQNIIEPTIGISAWF